MGQIVGEICYRGPDYWQRLEKLRRKTKGKANEDVYLADIACQRLVALNALPKEVRLWILGIAKALNRVTGTVALFSTWNRWAKRLIKIVSSVSKTNLLPVHPVSANAPRDAWIYQQYAAGQTLKEIKCLPKVECSKYQGWKLIKTEQGIYAAARRHALKNRLPPCRSPKKK